MTVIKTFIYASLPTNPMPLLHITGHLVSGSQKCNTRSWRRFVAI